MSGKTEASLTNIKLGWKCLVTNALAFLHSNVNYESKKFYIISSEMKLVGNGKKACGHLGSFHPLPKSLIPQANAIKLYLIVI